MKNLTLALRTVTLPALGHAHSGNPQNLANACPAGHPQPANDLARVPSRVTSPRPRASSFADGVARQAIEPSPMSFSAQRSFETHVKETPMKHTFRHAFPLAILLATGSAATFAQGFGAWGNPQPVTAINTAAAEGCPIEAPDGLALYFASNRSSPDAQGKQDNWRATRGSVQADWSVVENLGAPANSGEFDYCPTPLASGDLLFVSSRQTLDDCYPGDTPPPPPTGGPSAGDIFLAHENSPLVWSTPVNLGCYPNGPNTAGAEFSPSMVTTSAGTFLFFSSDGYPDSQGQDIYMSQVLDDGTVTAGQRVAELSTAADDRMPNVRADGLEIVFSSSRDGNMDIYAATRPNAAAPWSAPQRIDNPAINTSGSETRSSLSADGTRLYFGRKVDAADPGDVFVAQRTRIAPPHVSSQPVPGPSVPMLVALALLLVASAWIARHASVTRRSQR